MGWEHLAFCGQGGVGSPRAVDWDWDALAEGANEGQIQRTLLFVFFFPAFLLCSGKMIEFHAVN